MKDVNVSRELRLITVPQPLFGWQSFRFPRCLVARYMFPAASRTTPAKELATKRFPLIAKL
jgi:hypothetical protein